MTPDGALGAVTGVWQIASGTDDYDRVSGHGTDEFDGLAQTLFLASVMLVDAGRPWLLRAGTALCGMAGRG